MDEYYVSVGGGCGGDWDKGSLNVEDGEGSLGWHDMV